MDKKRLPKILAIYLPQFYETEDNNRWWGKGFTDWETVKSAERYFQGHHTPWVPLNGNYYDLSKPQSLKAQAELAKQYGVDGFCFYHYYFKDGKKELELPAENLLRNKDIDIRFCFNWANESWIRSWSRMDGNVWSEKYETASGEHSDGTLVLQDYGTETEWKAHFEYLLPFFSDKRYIRIDDKPVFIIYRPNSIKPLKQMVELWRKLALDAGLEGLYLIGVNVNVSDLNLDASLVYEPRNAINRMNVANQARVMEQVRCFDYQEIWKKVLETIPYMGCKTYFTGVTGYDDTPRRGRSGECMTGNSPEIFRDGIEKLLVKSIQHGNELVFINAWNEWGEGMYLEPDEEYQYAYLTAVKEARQCVERQMEDIKSVECRDEANDEIANLIYDVKKYKSFVNILDKWLMLERERKIRLRNYCKEKGIETVAIYGMALLGKQLYSQMRSEGIKVGYGIDRYVGQCGKQLQIYRPEAEYPPVDAIIITAYDTANIAKMISAKCNAQILTLEEMLDYFGDKE